MTTKEVLVKARGLIEQGWIQGQDARNLWKMIYLLNLLTQTLVSSAL